MEEAIDGKHMGATLTQRRAPQRFRLRIAAPVVKIGLKLRSASTAFVEPIPHCLAAMLALAITTSASSVTTIALLALGSSFYAILFLTWLYARWLVFLSLTMIWRLLFALTLLAMSMFLLVLGDYLASLSIAITLPFMYEGPRSFLFSLHVGLLTLLIFFSGQPEFAGSLGFHFPGPVPVYCATLCAILAHRLLFRTSLFAAWMSDRDYSLIDQLTKSHRSTEDQLADVAHAIAQQMPYALCWQERGSQWRGLIGDRSGNRHVIEDSNLLNQFAAADFGDNIVVDCYRGNALRLTPRDIVRRGFDPQLPMAVAKLLGTNTLLFVEFDSLELRAIFAMVSDRPLSLGALSHFRGLIEAVADQTETLVHVTDWRRRILREARALAARDMHDSVLQTLGGLRMRIAALGHAAVLADVGELDSIVAAEQRSLRMILEQSERAPGDAVDLNEHFDRRLRSLARQWDVVCSFKRPLTAVMVSAETAFECEFLLREAVANAVKHAGSRVLTAGLALDHGLLIITLSSDGSFAKPITDGAIALVSRSLTQRVERLDGTAYTEPTSRGALLSIRIPMERK